MLRRNSFALIAFVFALACGKDSSPTGPTSTPTATVTITDLSATVGPRDAGGLMHRVSFRINETGGRTAVTVNSITLSWPTGGTANASSATPIRISAGSSSGTINVNVGDENSQTAAATSVTVGVGYSEDGGRVGSTSGSTEITQTAPPPPPPPPIRFFTLSGVVSDLLTGRPVGGAAVAATDSSNTRRTSTTDGNGYYSIAPREGSVTITVTANGYQSTTRTITLSSDTNLAIPLATLSQPPPVLSCGAPTIVTCINGGHQGTPTARCDDGAWSCSTTPSGTCSGHGGIACRVCPGPLC